MSVTILCIKCILQRGKEADNFSSVLKYALLSIYKTQAEINNYEIDEAG